MLIKVILLQSTLALENISKNNLMPLLSPEINVLEKICNKVSKIIIRDFGEVERLQVSKKGPGDFVTKTDKKVEKLLLRN